MRIFIKNILLSSVVASDWVLFSALSSLSLFLVGLKTKISVARYLILFIWYAIIIVFTIKGLNESPWQHVLKNSLFFYIIPLASLLRTGTFFSKRFVNLLILIIVGQCVVVVALHSMGYEVFQRDGWFVKFFGLYSSGGTVVGNRFYNYNFTLLMCLIFMKVALQHNSLKLVDVLIIIFSIVFSGSKGIVLSGFVLVCYIILADVKKINFLKIFTIISCVSVFANFFPLYDLFLATFDPSDISNVTRLTVTLSLIQNTLTIWGEGFGASLPQELIRDVSRPYGFEISYVSYYHKLGIFFVLLMLLFQLLFGTRCIWYALPIWVTALGNPTLTHLMNFIFVYLAVCTSRLVKSKSRVRK
ncbi:hypothetical protein [Roseobacter sp. HKCCD5988]|uniref:hypothetical protein n=1 Tax=Roseobacter sp. HKCCD5988 TaxID=3120338 RepID=UPI0030EB3799